MRRTVIFTPFRILMLFMLVTLMSIICLPYLTVDLYPVPQSPDLAIGYSLPNAGQSALEQEVTSVLEGLFSQLAQLKTIKSESGAGVGSIALHFDRSTNMTLKRLEVAELIRRVYPRLPEGTSYPVVSAVAADGGAEDAALLTYFITAPVEEFQLRKMATAFYLPYLSPVPGISGIAVSGSRGIQLTVQYDKDKCKAWGITTGTVIQALHELSVKDYAWSVDTKNGGVLFLKIKQPSYAQQDIEALPLRTSQGSVIRLADVARVFREETEPQNFFRINGRTAVALTIRARRGVNKIELAEKIRSVMDGARGNLPAGMDSYLEYDDTRLLRKEIQNNYSRLGLSIGLLLLCILITYRNWRYPVILCLGLVVNIGITILLVRMFQVAIHLYTLAGMAIALGIMTDNAIVVIDNYHFHKSRNILPALTGSMLITIAALGLTFFLPEDKRNNLIDFSIVIMLSLIASIVVALWFTPSLCDLFAGGAFRSAGRHRLFNAGLFNVVAGRYFSIIGFLARFRAVVLLVLLVCFGAALRQFKKNVSLNAVYPAQERPRLVVAAALPFGSTPGQMNAVISGLEKYLSGFGDIDQYEATVAGGHDGRVEITFKKEIEHSFFPYQLKSKLIALVSSIGGVSWNITGIGRGFVSADMEEISSFRVTLKGYNYAELERQADSFAVRLAAHNRVHTINIDENADFSTDENKHYLLSLDEDKLARFHTTKPAIADELFSMGKPGTPQGYISLRDDLTPVFLKEDHADSFSIDDLVHRPFVLDSNRQVSLDEVGKIKLLTIANSIHKENREYIRIISFRYTGTRDFGEAMLDKEMKQARARMPVGYSVYETEFPDTRWEKEQEYLLIGLLVLAIFFTGTVLFENFRQPLYIITMIPLAFMGLFLTFLWGGFYFDDGGYAAFVLLGGLVASASIYVINDLNIERRRHPGKRYNEQLISVVMNRSRTVFLTTICTACGLFPFLLKGQTEVFWFSMAAGTLGGLAASLLAVFTILPLLLWKRRVPVIT